MVQEISIWCVAIPAAIMMIAAGLVWLLERLLPESAFSWASNLVFAVAWSVAIVVPLAGRQQWAWWPEEAWRQTFWPIAVAGVLLGAAHRWKQWEPGLRWVVTALLVQATAYFALPDGEGWEDIALIHRDWFFLICTSAVMNMWSLWRISRDGGERWGGWLAVAGLAGALIYAGGIYGSISEWTTAALVATLIATVLSAFKLYAGAAAVIYPAILFQATTTASARFYAYDEQIPWVLGLLLFAPTLVATVDWPLRKQHSIIRIFVAAMLAALILMILANYLAPSGGEEDW